MITAHSDPSLLTIPEAAKVCGVTRMTTWRWVKSNRIEHTKTLGGHYRISPPALNEFIIRCNGNQRQWKDRDKPTILVVDDDHRIQRYLFRLLTDRDFDVKTCSDGFQAGIGVMKFQPHLLILDLYMPNMDGFQVCQTLKEDPDTSHIPILAISGHPSKVNIQRVQAAGADAFLAKPLDRRALLNHIHAMLSLWKRQPARLREE